MRRCAYAATFLLVLGSILLSALVTGAEELGSFEGTVLDPEGRPLPGAEVALRVPHGNCKFVLGEHITARVVTDEEGRFELPVPRGDMEIYVRHPEYAPGWGGASDDAVVILEEASWIEGYVETPAKVRVYQGAWRFADERVEGRFRCGPLPPDQPLSVSVTSDERRPFAERILLERGETRTLEITLERGAQLTGRVVPPHEGATIHAHGKDGRTCTATTADDGTFTVTGLDAGWVRLVAISTDRPVRVLDTQTGEDVEVRWSR